MTVLSPREQSIFACVADTLLAPAPPLPPIRETDAVMAFDAWLARAPRINRVALRAVLLTLEIAPRLTRARTRWRRLPAARRLAILDRVAARPAGHTLVEALRAAAAVSYYGDARVSALLGYAPRAQEPLAR
ncbi:hypothetical protein DSM104299_01296 [Baekduia alba]|uniref:hypothetical protein n=1 Tax=Baekduia alba TaxID=2997333 RepID=UPI002342374F|nr:hypothetical protein [Baekduia alba]WCB92599.1 hypothetical protein DSM104299_01296 [Baekduia alba]